MRKWLAPMMVVMLLVGCKGVGMGQMSSKGWDHDQEAKDEDTYWDYFYGRKKAGLESKDWKDFYKPPNTDETKADYCGFWGNCAGDAGTTAHQQEECNFYGNCKGTQLKQGWW